MPSMFIEDFIKKTYDENPGISKDEMKKKLRAIKDPCRPRKMYWRTSTIDNRVERFYRNVVSHVPPAEPSIEGKEIKKHVDIFAPSCAPSKPTIAYGEHFDLDTYDRIAITDDIEPSEDAQLSEKEFKTELVSIVTEFKKTINDIQKDISDLRSFMKQDLASLKKDINDLHKKTATFVPETEVEYDFIELRKPLIETIKKSCEELNIDDESDYIETLLTKGPASTATSEEISIFKDESERYNKIISLIKERGGSAFLKFYLDGQTGQLSYEEGKLMKFGITKKGLGMGIAIGAAIGISLFFLFSSIGISF